VHVTPSHEPVNSCPSEFALVMQPSSTGSDRGLAATLVLSGELDLCSARDAERVLIRALTAVPDLVVLDLSGLVFTDLAGISSLDRVRAHVQKYGGTLVLQSVRPQAGRLLELSGVAHAFGVRDDVRGEHGPCPTAAGIR